MLKVSLASLVLVFTVCFQAAANNNAQVACQIEKGNSKENAHLVRMTHYLKDGSHHYNQGDLKGTVQVKYSRLIQVAITDDVTAAFTQEDPRDLYKKREGKSFLQSLSSGDHLMIRCTQI